MCTRNYVKSRTPITDLSNYSLALNNNIPTTYATTSPMRPAPLPLPCLPKLSEFAELAEPALPPPHYTSSALPSLRTESGNPSKLDLLIQTAAMQSMLPSSSSATTAATGAGLSQSTAAAALPQSAKPSQTAPRDFAAASASDQTPPSLASPSSSSYTSSPASVNGTPDSNYYVYSRKRPSPEFVSDNEIEPKRAKKSPKLDIANLVSHPPTTEDASKKKPQSIKLASPSATSKRQRSGPSCDCCRSRKIKCDSEIIILSELPQTPEKSNTSNKASEIANCNFIYQDPQDYQYFEISAQQCQQNKTNSKLSQFKYLKFKQCSACTSKKLSCSFSKGFTRNDIIKFNKSEKLQTFSNYSSDSSLSPENVQDGGSSDFESGSTSNNNNNASSSCTPAVDGGVVVATAPVVGEVTGIESSNTEVSARRFSTSSNSGASKASKKTSCASCRYKKIRCIKVEGSVGPDCLSCSKKHLECAYV